MQPAKARDQRRQHAQAEHHARVHAQQALGRLADGGDIGVRGMDVPENAFELARIFLARFGQHDLARGAQKQLHVQRRLEIGDQS
ncbi:hypothetical protein D3C71_2142970 [compost metagenome]